MKHKNIIISLGVLFFVLSGCNKLEDYNVNPNKTSNASPGMLATRLILNIARQNTGNGKTYLMNHVNKKYLIWTENKETERQYNYWQRTDAYGGMNELVNVEKMVEAAAGDEALQNAYKAVGHFIRVYKFLDLTLRVGDIPYSEAMKGESDDNFFPKYDTQKEVFMGLLNELEEADRLLQNAKAFTGDPVYGGNVEKWRKAVNSLELSVLIHLYLKENDADLRVKQRFQALLSKPLFESNADNFQLTYSDKANQQYPYYKDRNNYMDYSMMSSVLIDSLKRFQDYRLFCYADPMAGAINDDGLDASDFNAYAGVDPTADYTFIEAMHGVVNTSRRYSMMATRYSDYAPGEPIYLLSYSDVNFILAEACVRGFITGDAWTYYETGIRAAMNFTGGNMTAAYTPTGREITPAYIDAYLTNPGVQFESTAQRQIEQIATQRYLANFLQAPWEGLWQLRRINIPYIPVNPATNENIDDRNKLPVRWMYPNSEYTYNGDNVQAAVDRQFSGNDSADGVMWILRP